MLRKKPRGVRRLRPFRDSRSANFFAVGVRADVLPRWRRTPRLDPSTLRRLRHATPPRDAVMPRGRFGATVARQGLRAPARLAFSAVHVANAGADTSVHARRGRQRARPAAALTALCDAPWADARHRPVRRPRRGRPLQLGVEQRHWSLAHRHRMAKLVRPAGHAPPPPRARRGRLHRRPVHARLLPVPRIHVQLGKHATDAIWGRRPLRRGVALASGPVPHPAFERVDSLARGGGEARLRLRPLRRNPRAGRTRRWQPPAVRPSAPHATSRLPPTTASACPQRGRPAAAGSCRVGAGLHATPRNLPCVATPLCHVGAPSSGPPPPRIARGPASRPAPARGRRVPRGAAALRGAAAMRLLGRGGRLGAWVGGVGALAAA